ncbi:DUF3089 domain-containing protein [Gordonibacter massiliensis (ex Traore et al. 2017)]|uniref:DUF3089 domain-containing protein n=1 Tax=Gordonibacter massiliensis (ex Traore et al. 2017) TaxID=1841863 RepID=UPI001C8BD5A9|nr:DUF3089 domain-containing protein [Gordonibacter massiliensis (ex Traore et al. 2017)]MBX9034544.1 DUF3089 domain-containing protein [Gordonibacter massiliensis (ex Traore et al. 2017)]
MKHPPAPLRLTQRPRNLMAALLALCLTFAGTALAGCSDGRGGYSTNKALFTSVYDPDDLSAHIRDQPVDYADPAYWVSRPSETPLPVDVFYFYPTSWYKVSDDESNLCAIDNEIMRETAPAVFEEQATAFETAGNVFAPYYRQIDAAYYLGESKINQMKLMSGAPLLDAFAALDYYFEHCNEGRPFILAGHSQGSNLLEYVLTGYMNEHPELKERMVAAYLIGYGVMKNTGYLTGSNAFKFAEGPDDTGVVISYNTEAPEIEGTNPVTEPGALNINPITWTRTSETAPASASKGARIGGVDVGPLADATVDRARGAVICSTVDPDEHSSANGVFPRGVYHAQDYAFYYYDLRANAELRAATYLARHGRV